MAQESDRSVGTDKSVYSLEVLMKAFSKSTYNVKEFYSRNQINRTADYDDILGTESKALIHYYEGSKEYIKDKCNQGLFAKIWVPQFIFNQFGQNARKICVGCLDLHMEGYAGVLKNTPNTVLRKVQENIITVVEQHIASILYRINVHINPATFNAVQEYVKGKGKEVFLVLSQSFLSEMANSVRGDVADQIENVRFSSGFGEIILNKQRDPLEVLSLCTILALINDTYLTKNPNYCKELYDSLYGDDLIDRVRMAVSEEIDPVMELTQKTSAEVQRTNQIGDQEIALLNQIQDENEKARAEASSQLDRIELILKSMAAQGQLEGDGGKRFAADGFSFEGSWQNGVLVGKGKMTLPDGTIVEGDWSEGKIKNGTVKYSDGGVYEGELKGGKPSGQGKRVYANKSVFEGEWDNGFWEGEGTLTVFSSDGDTRIFKGTWGLDGDPYSGKGEIDLANGNHFEGKWRFVNETVFEHGTLTGFEGVYEGDLVDEKKDGSGKITYSDGSSYEGKWKNDQRHGYGEMHEDDGRIVICEWNEDNYGDSVKMIFPNGQIYEGEMDGGDGNRYYGKLSNSFGTSYEGQLKDGLPDGRGKKVFPDGRVFEGEWLNGQLNGKGIQTQPDGQVWDGNWKDGMMHGLGKWTYGPLWYEGEWKDGSPNGSGKGNLNDGITYEGEWKDWMPSGHGKASDVDGLEYEGEWKEGKLISGRCEIKHSDIVYEGEFSGLKWNGNGKVTFSDGSWYNGEWKDGKQHGEGEAVNIVHKDKGTWKNGSFVFGRREHIDLGDVYEGELCHGLFNGHGKMIRRDGSWYDGEWKNGCRHGLGEEHYTNKDVYKGQWTYGVPDGQGVLTKADGTVIEGIWSDGNFINQGRNSMTTGKAYGTDGSVYEGEWENGQPSGWGKKIYSDGSSYEGEWKDGLPNGNGKAKLNISKSSNDQIRLVEYQGGWKDGCFHGTGKQVYEDGTIYEGELKDDKRSGYGRIKYSSGGWYEGEFKDDRPHGKGKEGFPGGGSFEGEFKNGKADGIGMLSIPGRDPIKVEMRDEKVVRIIK